MFLVVVGGVGESSRSELFQVARLYCTILNQVTRKAFYMFFSHPRRPCISKFTTAFHCTDFFKQKAMGATLKKNKKNTRFFFSNCSKTVKDRKISIKVKAAHEEYLLKMVLHIVLPLKIVCDNCFCSSRHSACSRCRPNHLV